MGRQRFYLPNARGRLFQPVRVSVAPVVPSTVPQVVTPGLEKRLLRQPRGRFYNYIAPPSAKQGPVVGQVLRRTHRLLPSARGRITNYAVTPVATKGPLVGQVLRPRLQPLRYPTRNRIISWVLPNNLPPVFWVPQALVSRRIPVYPRRYGHTFSFNRAISKATTGPVAITLIRQAGTDNHILRIRRGAVVAPPWPAITPPPPPPPPSQGTDDDVGASLGRRKWHWKNRAVKTSLPKSLVWDWID